MAIMRKCKVSKYTTVDNYFINDKRLDPEGKGYLLYMLSKPDNWKFTYKNIKFDLNVGERNISTNMKKLERLNYLKRDRLKDQKGEFEWNYLIYEIPRDMVPKMENSPSLRNEPMEYEGVQTDPILINTNKLNTNIINDNIDKIDKTKFNIPEHHYLTKELFKLNYLSEDDSSSFLFDDLFIKYLDNGHTFGEIISSIHYIVPRVVKRNFKDEEGKEIKNRYGYFKNSFEFNISKFNNMPDELYPELDKDDYEL